MALPTSIFSAHFSRVYFTSGTVTNAALVTDDESSAKVAFEAGTPTELVGVRSIPPLEDKVDTGSYTIYNTGLSIELPVKRTLSPIGFTCNWKASEFGVGTALTTSIKTGKLVVVCVVLSPVFFTTYADAGTKNTARFYAWGRFTSKVIAPSLNDAVTVDLTFQPYSTWSTPV